MRVLHVVAETPLSFLQHLKDITYIERRPLRYGSDVLHCRPDLILTPQDFVPKGYNLSSEL